MITDVHTHRKTQKYAVINADTDAFIPVENLLYSVGIHPWDIENIDIEKQFNRIATIAANCQQVIAIGETGLDSNIKTPLNIQQTIFEKHIELSELLRKPLIIHCVRSSNNIVKIHHLYKPKQPWIIHGFHSNSNVLRQFLSEQNIYISIGEKFNTEALKAIPEERILAETDESLLQIEEIYAVLAFACGKSIECLSKSIAQNIYNIFGKELSLTGIDK